MWTLAQESGAQEILTLLNYGVLGIVVIAAAFGWIEFKPAVTRLLKDLERQHAQIDSLVKVYEDKVIPTLTEANRTLTRLAERRWDEDDGGTEPRRPRR